MTRLRWATGGLIFALLLTFLVVGATSERSLHERIQGARLRAELGCGRPTLLAAEPPSLATIERTDWPGLLAAVVTGSPHERWRAIKIVGELNDRRAVPALLTALADARGTVRPCLAARSLGILRDPEALQALIAVTYTAGNDDLRVCAMKALGLLRDARAVPALVDAIERRDMLLVAADALARVGSVDGALAVVAAVDDPKLRPWLALSLGEFGVAEVEPALRSIEADRSLPDAARGEAREGLWKTSVLTSPNRERALTRVLREESEVERRSWAAYRLGDEGIASGIPALAEALGDASDVVRMAATVALVRLGPDSEAILLERVSEPGPEGDYAVAALGFIGGPGALIALEHLEMPERRGIANGSLRWLRLRGVRNADIARVGS